MEEKGEKVKDKWGAMKQKESKAGGTGKKKKRDTGDEREGNERMQENKWVHMTKRTQC